ncbi:MAG: GldG family protein [Clostridiaceae bacterium]
MEKKNGLKKFLHSRNLKYGSNSVILVLAVVVIAVLVNLLVGMADLKLDLTPNKLFSLSDVTKKQLKDLKQEVQIIGLFDDGKIGASDDYKEVTDLLGLYEKNSNIKVKYIDPDRNPGILNELDPDDTMDLGSASFVVKSTVNGKEKKKKLDYYDLFTTDYTESYEQYKTGSTAEQGFTGAIKYVTSEVTPVVYFTEGHNEIDVDSEYENLKYFLDKNNYLVKKLNLLTTDKIPEDAELVIVASPKNDITIGERDVLETYLKSGGKAVFMFDYLENDPSYDQLNNLLGTYNVAVNYDKVKETNSNNHLPNDEYTIVLDVPSNSIIPQAFNTLINNSRSISILKNTKDYIKTTSLMSTSDGAVGEMVNKSRGEDLKGPLDIAVAVENQGGTKTSKILVMGNASFISNSAADAYGQYYNNSITFFLQAMSWMIDKTDELIVPAKQNVDNTIQITQLQSSMMGGVLIVIFPLLILGSGLMVYLRRRHL